MLDSWVYLRVKATPVTPEQRTLRVILDVLGADPSFRKAVEAAALDFFDHTMLNGVTTPGQLRDICERHLRAAGCLS